MKEQIKKYFCGKVIFHSGSGMFFVQDDPKVGDKHIADIRGWGNIQYLFPKPEGGLDFDKAAEFQDSIGEFIAEAINDKLAGSHIANVMGSFEPTDEQIEQASIEHVKTYYKNVKLNNDMIDNILQTFEDACEWYREQQRIRIGENVR